MTNPIGPDNPSVLYHENEFFLSGDVSRFSKFVSHLDFFRMSSTVPGAIVECGVFLGTSLLRFIKFRELLQNTSSRKIIGFDVFGRFPEATVAGDKLIRQIFVDEAGDSGISKEDLEELLRTQNLEKNVILVAGDVCESIDQYLRKDPGLVISLLNVDVDIYEPTRTVLDKLYPRVAPGGVVILDDYESFPGARQAVSEYFSLEKVEIKKLPYSHNMSYLVKPQ